ncbi:MAG: ribosome maturation factor RimM [Candidatus Dadabacteria bacterium]|nr:ribosome maturation factor RimM [Candidatus Dadabacteria bacterium]
MDNYTDRVEVGIIINTFGVKGEVKVMPITDSPADFAEFKRVFVSKPGAESAEFEVRKSRPHKKWAILKLKGIDTRDDAFKLKDYNVYVAREALAELDEGTYYERDLVGMKVYTMRDEFIGVISDILKTKANDIYQVRREGGMEILIPAIKDVVKKVDVGANRMVIDPIQGLI